MNKIPKWIWIFGIIILIIIISALLDNNSEISKDKNINDNNYEQNESKITEESIEKTLENYPLIKKQMDNIISELKESEWYSLIKFAFISSEEKYDEDGSISVTYYLDYTSESRISFIFDNNELSYIYYYYGNKDVDSSKVYNRKLYLTYLSNINITENSFDNSDVHHKWDTYINILSGLNCDTWATTINNISVQCTNSSFLIEIH